MGSFETSLYAHLPCRPIPEGDEAPVFKEEEVLGGRLLMESQLILPEYLAAVRWSRPVSKLHKKPQLDRYNRTGEAV